MSYWVYLQHEHETVEVEAHEEGGTYALGGINRAELNITYNYGKQFYEAGFYGEADNLREALDKVIARDAIPRLEAAVEKLGVETDNDYWRATAGNAGHALSILLGWAKQHPDAVFRVS